LANTKTQFNKKNFRDEFKIWMNFQVRNICFNKKKKKLDEFCRVIVNSTNLIIILKSEKVRLWEEINHFSRQYLSKRNLIFFRVKYPTHPCGLQTVFFALWILIFIIAGTCGMEKDRNGTSVHFSIQNWRKSTLAPRYTIQNETRGHTIFIFYF
jgi:hypothetical protein